MRLTTGTRKSPGEKIVKDIKRPTQHSTGGAERSHSPRSAPMQLLHGGIGVVAIVQAQHFTTLNVSGSAALTTAHGAHQ
jgi:hypothetical protein